MKRLITIIFAFITLNLSAQDLIYKETQDIEFFKTVKNGTKYDSYKSKNGTLMKVGDTLIVGSPATDDSQYTEYIGTQKVFSLIIIGGMGGAIMGGLNYYPATGQGDVFTIEKIWVSHTGMSKKSPLNVIITAREPNLPKMANKRTIMDIEKALLLGEIVSPNAPMTREQAIAKLKETKDLMDLGLIGEDEYNKLKNELTPIIMNKK